MATSLLSSSPARMAYHDPVVVISSSPDFPSICELLPKPTKKPPLRSGSNAAPIPEGAPTAFMTASAIRNAEQDVTTERQPPVSSTALQPKSASDDASIGLGTAKRQARAAGTTTKRVKSQETKAQDAADALPTNHAAAEVPAKKPSRKPRQTKDGVMAQTTLPKGKVTKPASKEAPTRKRAETVSRHFTPQNPAPAPRHEHHADPIHDEPVSLEPALRRRMSWTPPPETVPTPCLADSSVMKEPPSSVPSAHGNVFKTLQDTYGRNVDADLNGNAALPAANADVLGKRKLIEMVAPPGNKQEMPEPSPTKPKAAKKKARTITELATAAYRLPEVEDVSPEEPKQDSLFGYLETNNGGAEPASKTAGTKGKGSRSPAKPKPKQTKKKEERPKHMLLSPTSAMRQVARQDFVFGTASQLATEDDPQLLRALHEAMKASNQPDSDPFASPGPLNSNLAIRKRQGPGLWSAGARYDDGDLLEVDVLDLTRSSPLALAQLVRKAPCAGREPADQGATSGKVCNEIEMSDHGLDVNNSPSVTHPTRHLLSAACPPAIQVDSSSPAAQDHPESPASETDFQPPPSNQEQHQLLLSQSNSPRQEHSQVPPRPNFELYTDARLAREIASYGFKAVKKRSAMVALLTQCWDSQHRTGLGSRTAQVTVSTMTLSRPASPSRPRGRPRKNSLSVPVGPSTPGKPARNKCVSDSVPGSAPLEVGKRPRGRPRKASTVSGSHVTGAPAPSGLGRKKSASVSEGKSDSPAEKRPRRRTIKEAAASAAKCSPTKATASPKRARAALNPTAPTPATPRRHKAPAKSGIEIPDSDLDDPFASSPASSPSIQDDVFSPPAMDLSVTEDTESSLIASPTTQQVSLFRYITQAVVSAPPAKDPANPSWHEKMLMYDPIILEDLTAWLNSGQLDRVGYDGEVAPGDVKKWCESKSVCCLWRVNLRRKERKRL